MVKKAKTIEVLDYTTMEVLVGKGVVRVARVGGVEPVVDLRSLGECVGVGWMRWEAVVMASAVQQVLELHVARDAAGRRTRLVWISRVPQLLADAEQVLRLLHPAAACRIDGLRRMWRSRWSEIGPRDRLGSRRSAVNGEANTSAASHSKNRSHSLISSPAVRITRETEQQVLALVADGLSRAEIGRRLRISKASTSLLARGRYTFSKGA